MKISIFEHACPHRGAVEGPFLMGRSLWLYCREHRVKWLSGFDTAPADAVSEDAKRGYL